MGRDTIRVLALRKLAVVSSRYERSLMGEIPYINTPLMGKALPGANILLDSESQSPMRQKTIGNQASLVLLPQNLLVKQNGYSRISEEEHCTIVMCKSDFFFLFH